MRKVLVVFILLCFSLPTYAAKDTNTYLEPVGLQYFDAKDLSIKRIQEGKPVANAGLQIGDIIKKINKKKINNVQQCLAYIDTLDEDKTIFEIQRGEEKLVFEVIPDKEAPRYGFNFASNKTCIIDPPLKPFARIEGLAYVLNVRGFVNEHRILILTLGVSNWDKTQPLVIDPLNVKVTAGGIKLKQISPEEAINIVYAGLNEVLGGPIPAPSTSVSQNVTVEAPKPRGYTVSGPGGFATVTPHAPSAGESFSNGLAKGMQARAALTQAQAAAYPMKRQQEIDQLVIRRSQDYQNIKRTLLHKTILEHLEVAEGYLYFDAAVGSWPIVVKVKFDEDTVEKVTFGPEQKKRYSRSYSTKNGSSSEKRRRRRR